MTHLRLWRHLLQFFNQLGRGHRFTPLISTSSSLGVSVRHIGRLAFSQSHTSGTISRKKKIATAVSISSLKKANAVLISRTNNEYATSSPIKQHAKTNSCHSM